MRQFPVLAVLVVVSFAYAQAEEEEVPPLGITPSSYSAGDRTFREDEPEVLANVQMKEVVGEPEVTERAAIYVVGGTDHVTWYYRDIEMPPELLDADGGRIRMIMQHELNPHDELRMVDLSIAAEETNDNYGRRGRHPGRFGWTRQTGGGEHAWILGDNVRHNLAEPWHWAWILDHSWAGGGGRPLGGNKIRLVSHPHVTTRYIFYKE